LLLLLLIMLLLLLLLLLMLLWVRATRPEFEHRLQRLACLSQSGVDVLAASVSLWFQPVEGVGFTEKVLHLHPVDLQHLFLASCFGRGVALLTAQVVFLPQKPAQTLRY
jgi:hypothetical protein